MEGGWRNFVTLLKSGNEAFWSNSTGTFISGTPVTALLILASANVRRPSGEQTTAQGGDLIAIFFRIQIIQG